ncbi:hypothetical protein ACJX0J_030418, partial [Zea mays]
MCPFSLLKHLLAVVMLVYSTAYIILLIYELKLALHGKKTFHTYISFFDASFYSNIRNIAIEKSDSMNNARFEFYIHMSGIQQRIKRIIETQAGQCFRSSRSTFPFLLLVTRYKLIQHHLPVIIGALI